LIGGKGGGGLPVTAPAAIGEQTWQKGKRMPGETQRGSKGTHAGPGRTASRKSQKGPQKESSSL